MTHSPPAFTRNLDRRRVIQALIAAPIAVSLSQCGGSGGSKIASNPTRTWKMGFSPNPPRIDTQAVIQGIDLWSQRAELAIIHEELPWTDLLNGMSPDAILDRDKMQLVAYLRGKNLQLAFMADLTDGLSRAEEAPLLRQAGASITDPAVRQLYRDYVLAVQRKLAPEYLGLAAETNLIRAIAPAAVYSAVVRAANDAAADLAGAGASAKLFISAQVETAWGKLGASGAYSGIEADVADFPFMQWLGLSSYPYFAFARPEDLPSDYYSRLLNGRSIPAMVTEGGWTSTSLGTIDSSADIQARYITRHAQLLDSINARAVLQLQFADLDIASLPAPVPANLPLFAAIGLSDSNFMAKPALARWDALFARRLVAPSG
jgi:hypothetical protein